MRISTPEEIGQVARQRRIDMGLSQDELAERAGVTRQWLSRFEQAKTDSSMTKVMVVLRELELSVDIRSPEQSSITVPMIRFPRIDPEMLLKLNAAAEAAVNPARTETTRLALERLVASGNLANIAPNLVKRLSELAPDLSSLSRLADVDPVLRAAAALKGVEAHEAEDDK